MIGTPPRVLMCSPRYAPVLEGERSWVADSDPLDPVRAHDEWLGLRELVDAHIGPVVDLQPEPWAPAMTFTRDLALVTPEAAIALMPTSVRGPFEVPLVHRAIAGLGIELRHAADPLRIDGGNVLADAHGRLLIGVASAEPDENLVTTVRHLEAATGRQAHKVPLVGGRFPHIDMAISDLCGNGWLIYPDALPGFHVEDPDWRALFLGRPIVVADTEDGERLGCNLVVGENVAVGPEISSLLRSTIESLGVSYHATPLDELRKAGGGAHCLTLELPAADSPPPLR